MMRTVAASLAGSLAGSLAASLAVLGGVSGLVAMSACGPASSQAGPVAMPLENTTEAAQVTPEPPKGLFTKVADAHRLLPPGAEGYFGFDVRALRSASILDKYEEALTSSLPGEAAKIKSDCGLDVMSDFDWVLGSFGMESEVAMVIVKGNFTKTQVEECLVKINSATITTEGDLQVYRSSGETDLYAAWPSDSVVMIGDQRARALLEEAATRTTATEIDSGVKSNLGNVDTSAAVWFSMEPTSSMAAGLPIKDLSAVRLTVEASSTLDLVVAAEFGSSNKASEAHTMLSGGIGMMKGQPGPYRSIVDKLQIAHTDRVVSANLNLTEDDLVTLESLAQMMGMGLGSQGGAPPPPLP